MDYQGTVEVDEGTRSGQMDGQRQMVQAPGTDVKDSRLVLDRKRGRCSRVLNLECSKWV